MPKIKIYLVNLQNPLILEQQGMDKAEHYWETEIIWKENLAIVQRRYIFHHETETLYIIPRNKILYIDMGNNN